MCICVEEQSYDGASPPKTSAEDEGDYGSKSKRARGSMWLGDDGPMEWNEESPPEDFYEMGSDGEGATQQWVANALIDSCDL